MAPLKGNEVKISNACKAMKRFGVSARTVKSSLKRLLKVYENNWVCIEDDGYKVLLDDIFEPQGPKKMEIVKHDYKLIDESEEEDEEETRPLKRTTLLSGEATCSTSLGYVCENGEEFLDLDCNNMDKKAHKNVDANANENDNDAENEIVTPSPCSSEIHIASSSNGKVKLSFSVRKPPPGFNIPNAEVVMKHVGDVYREKLQGFGTGFSLAQFFKDLCQRFLEEGNVLDHVDSKIPSFDNSKEPEKQGGSANDPIQGPRFVVSSEFDRFLSEKLRKQHMGEIHKPLFDVFKVSEKQGGLTIDPIQIPKFVVSSEFEQQMVEVDNRSFDNFKEPEKQVCLANDSEFEQQLVENYDRSFDSVKESEKQGCSANDPIQIPRFVVSNECEQQIVEIVNPSLDSVKESEKQGCPANGPIQIPRFEVSSEFDHCFNGKLTEQQMVGTDELSGSSSFPKDPSTVDLCSKNYWVADITRGLEKQEISVINEVDDEKLPTFTYIHTNENHKTANVKFVLARISDDSSCPNCSGDCLSSEVPCACAVETGGEFAYTTEGSVDEKFLKKCFDITLEPKKRDYFYCEDCPLERIKKLKKNQSQSGSCKGHLVRKFIKECWYKCGCGFNCRNRVVQRGIQAKLQVFMTPEGKGWGLRTLEDLPKGTFVCEYVGEIVTNSELFERNEQNKNEQHTYPVLLDADWSSEGFLKDEEALCLDATSFGNVARFINHRCVDANMVEIPVEVESPDHHYYHHAFFTTREVKAMEELTWDYGIDFDDDSHPVKAFVCKCGSKSCKAVKRRKRRRLSW